MAKRRISHQQKRRIASIQQKRRDRAGKNSHDVGEQLLAEQGLGPEQPGEVMTNFGQSLIVEDDAGQLHRCVSRQNLGAIVCGDTVIWQQAQSGEGVIVAVQPRQSLLLKPGFGGKLKPMAANIDQMIIVSAVKPQPNPYLIDRYLVAAENLPATPVILFNKVDLVDDSNRDRLRELETLYRSLGYQVIQASKTLDHGFDQLDLILKDKTSIMVGLSGVGKSSLIQHLLPEQDIRIGELSVASGEGTHTTTSSTLYKLSHGGRLIDSPGVRNFGLWHMSGEDMLHGFVELRPYIGLCKFSNCTHDTEPGCAIRQAVEECKISAQRFANYRKMCSEYAL